MRRGTAIVAVVILLTAAGRLWGRMPRPGAAARRSEARELADKRLLGVLATLWPAWLGSSPYGRVGQDDWAEADRRFVWTRQLAAALGEPGAGRPRDARRLPTPGPFDNDLASSEEAEDTPQVFSLPPGGMSWPVPGNLAAAFAPDDNPPRQGVVLRAAEGSPVLAAADGRVVFVGALRGLGRVVIVAHGERRHTVYGCLEQVDVAVGNLVNRHGVLGRSGFCGPVRAPGVYFELRFREKALNPAEWLAVRQ